jgi:PilZ domain
MGYEMHTEIAALEIERVVPEKPTGLRTSVRFPLSLHIRVMTSARMYEAVTDNISAHGLLMHLNELLEPGTEVDFLIEIPKGTIAPDETAAVHCRGRIVRSFYGLSAAYAAVVIDEYRFQ